MENPSCSTSYDISLVLFGTAKSARNIWFYFTKSKYSPGAMPVGKGRREVCCQATTNLDLWQDLQERYDLFITSSQNGSWNRNEEADGH
jgi:hypothetical protein